MKKTIRAFALLLALVMLLCGCESYDNFYNTFFAEKKIDRSVKIGVFEPVTGTDAQDAAAEIAGIELAHELYGTVLGRSVELVYADNESDVQLAPAAAEQLIEAGVSAILGSCKSTLSLAASDVIAKAKVPAIGITCVNPIITGTNDYYLRVCNIGSYEGDAAAGFVYKGLGASSAAVLCREGDDYNGAIADAFSAKMQEFTRDEFSVKVIEYPENTEDFSSFLFEASTVSSGVVFFPGSQDDARLAIKQAADQNYEFTWLGPSGWEGIEEDDDYILEEQDFLLGVCYVSGMEVGSVETETAEIFRRAYAEKYGEDKEPSLASALGFDAYLLALEGIRAAGTAADTEAITQCLYAVDGLEGATGMIKLDSNGDPLKDVAIDQIGYAGPENVYVVGAAE